MKTDVEETTRRFRKIIAALNAQIAISSRLRKDSQNLHQKNVDLREFLRETLLASMSRREHRIDN
jgi:hypothetical protein